MRRWTTLFIVLMLAACGGNSGSGSADHYRAASGRGMEKTRPDGDPIRRIVMLYPQAHEKVDVVYYHDGNYDQAALEKINQIMRDRHANVVGVIDPELIDYMVNIRSRLGLPQTLVFQVLSGYRTSETNSQLAVSNANVAKESLHMHGWAVDFRIDGVNGSAICEIAKTMQRGGVAYYPRDNHVHVDLGNIRTWHEARN
jgi:uncharacterized protein YcbK (DUF882 family)